MNSKDNAYQISGKSRLIRPQFSPGLMLQDDDLTQAVEYSRDLNRLLFGALFGCGVICGLKVSLQYVCKELKIQVTKGTALDGRGDPIYVPEPQLIALTSSCLKVPERGLVAIRRRELRCDPRDPVCAPEDEDGNAVFTRLRDGFEIRLAGKDDFAACSCVDPKSADGKADASPTCYAAHRAGECDCDCSTEWVVLGWFEKIPSAKEAEDAPAATFPLMADHRVRRFIRPRLMDDPTPPPGATLSAAQQAMAAVNDAITKGQVAADAASKAAADAKSDPGNAAKTQVMADAAQRNVDASAAIAKAFGELAKFIV